MVLTSQFFWEISGYLLLVDHTQIQRLGRGATLVDGAAELHTLGVVSVEGPFHAVAVAVGQRPVAAEDAGVGKGALVGRLVLEEHQASGK